MKQMIQLYKGKSEKVPEVLDENGIYFITDDKLLRFNDATFLDKDTIINLRKDIDKVDYNKYLGLSKDDKDYNTMFFIKDGSGMVFHGLLYINNPYWISVVDEMPDETEDNTMYFIKEK